MTVTAYRNISTGIPLVPSAFTVVVQLRVPNTGNFVILGRITATNPTVTPQTINTEMTTLDSEARHAKQGSDEPVPFLHAGSLLGHVGPAVVVL